MTKIKRDEFIDACESALGPLSVRFRLKLNTTRVHQWYSVAEFSNETTGVIFHVERRERFVQLELAALAAGKVEPRPPIIHQDTSLSTLPLSDVIASKGVANEPIGIDFCRLTIAEQIERLVGDLTAYATDVLAGDFSSFDRAEKRFKDRLQSRSGPIGASDREAFLQNIRTFASTCDLIAVGILSRLGPPLSISHV
jgi:hypothetical protein